MRGGRRPARCGWLGMRGFSQALLSRGVTRAFRGHHTHLHVAEDGGLLDDVLRRERSRRSGARASAVDSRLDVRRAQLLRRQRGGGVGRRRPPDDLDNAPAEEASGRSCEVTALVLGGMAVPRGGIETHNTAASSTLLSGPPAESALPSSSPAQRVDQRRGRRGTILVRGQPANYRRSVD